MNTKVAVALILGLIGGFVAGFMLANGLNRSEITELRSSTVGNSSDSTNAANSQDGFTISDEEIRTKIEQADKNPGDAAFQKDLGTALYQYARMKGDAGLIAESMRILERAHSLDPDDYTVLVDLGDANFDNGGFRKDNASFQKAREIYQKALKIKPNDANVRADLALTYYFAEPQDLARAIEEFDKALSIDPKQQRALQFQTQVLIENGDFDRASASLAKLKAAYPSNDSIGRLESQISKRQAVPMK